VQVLFILSDSLLVSVVLVSEVLVSMRSEHDEPFPVSSSVGGSIWIAGADAPLCPQCDDNNVAVAAFASVAVASVGVAEDTVGTVGVANFANFTCAVFGVALSLLSDVVEVDVSLKLMYIFSVSLNISVVAVSASGALVVSAAAFSALSLEKVVGVVELPTAVATSAIRGCTYLKVSDALSICFAASI